MILVETVTTKDPCPDAKELLPILQKAVEIYGMENVRVYISTRYVNGYEQQYLKVCCYKKENK